MDRYYTQKDHANGACTSSEYYGQFVNDEVLNYVFEVIEFTEVRASVESGYKHFEDIPLAKWDRICLPLWIGRVVKEKEGRRLVASDFVCIAKEAAMIWVETHPSNDLTKHATDPLMDRIFLSLPDDTASKLALCIEIGEIGVNELAVKLIIQLGRQLDEGDVSGEMARDLMLAAKKLNWEDLPSDKVLSKLDLN